MLYKITDNVAVYGIAAKGFSPPTLAEVRPSTGIFYQGLGPEFGWNYEAGIKGSILNNKLVFDVSYYYFNLKDAIVRRSDSTGAEYFVNAGGTIQKGIEFFIKAFLVSKTTSFVSSLVVTNSLSYQPYRFSSYVNSGNDYSGNKLTGVPRLINVNTIELRTSPGYYINFIYNQTSSIPLNDANSAFAERYHLLQGKIGYQKTSRNFSYNLYAGGDNLFNQLYSLGNDINAFGGRYFNPAPKRNYFIGVEIAF
jgi:iron complex outermembrane receptor protein